MNIPSKPIGVSSAEQSYRQLNTTIQRNDSANPLTMQQAGKVGPGLKQLNSPMDVLSSREIDTLRALFDSQANSFSTYGAAKLNNVQSGYLLDVRG